MAVISTYSPVRHLLIYQLVRCYLNQKPPISSLDKFFWVVIVPITWLVYMLMSYHYSHKLLRAVLQGLLQTLVSYAIVITSVLAFYTWTGSSF